jgi:hypothetical protein
LAVASGAAELLGVPVSAAVPVQRRHPGVMLAAALAELVAFVLLVVTASLAALALLAVVSLMLLALSAANRHRILAITAQGNVALSASARGVPRAVVGPLPRDLSLPEPAGVGQPLVIEGVTWWVDRSQFGRLRHARGLLETDGEDDGSEGEDDRRQDSEAVEVALDDSGAGGRRSQSSAEHLRQPAAAPAVEEDQEDKGD